MKQNLFLATLLLVPNMIFGELFLEITKGSEDPYKIAMISFEGDSRISKQLNKIMRNDLIRTGEFYILDEGLLLPVNFFNDELVYSDWKLIGMDYLVTGKIVKLNNSLDISYEIYDVHKKRKLRSSKVFGIPNQIRQLAHYTSDGIYESIPTKARQVYDVSGAGDTVISIAALGLALDLPLAVWSGLANLGGGIVCEYPGVIPINSNQLLEEASSDPKFETFFKH